MTRPTLAVPLAARAGQVSALPPPAGPAGPEVMSEAAREAVGAALDRGETHYTDRPGIPELRRAIAARLGRLFGLGLTGGGDVVVTCGATEARFVCLQELIRPGDTVHAPARPERVAGAAALRGATLGDAGGARLLYLSGDGDEATARAALAAVGPDVPVLFEIDGDATGGFHPAAIDGAAPRTVTIGEVGLSAGLAGARIGFLATPGDAAPALRDFKQALTICTTNLSQWAALAAMEPACTEPT